MFLLDIQGNAHNSPSNIDNTGSGEAICFALCQVDRSAPSHALDLDVAACRLLQIRIEVHAGVSNSAIIDYLAKYWMIHLKGRYVLGPEFVFTHATIC